MKMPFKNQIKIFIGVVVVVGACFATLMWSGSTLGIKAIYTMDRNGIIDDKEAWNKTLKKYNYGEKIDTAEKANEVLHSANKHSSVLDVTSKKAEKSVNIVNLPNSTKYEDLNIINIPAAYVNKGDEFAKKYANKLAGLIDESSGNIVLNLSNNLGGSFEPMILGANAVIPDGVLLSEVDNHKKSYPMTLKDGVLNGGMPNIHHSLTQLESRKDLKKKTDIKVAVVTNKNTASAAEYLLLALKNNPKVKSFGSDSAGFTSVNSGGVISDDDQSWWMVYTNGYLKSKKPIHGQQIFNNQKIKPDVSVPVSSIDDYKQNIVTPKENAELFAKIQAWFDEK